MKPGLFAKVTVLFIFFSANALRADWQWENDLAVAKATSNGFEAKFSFVNNGKTNVTVTGLTFDCPCTIYHFTASTVKPGEKGTLTVVVEHEKDGLDAGDLSVIAFGSPTTKPRELTIHLEKAGAAK